MLRPAHTPHVDLCPTTAVTPTPTSPDPRSYIKLLTSFDGWGYPSRVLELGDGTAVSKTEGRQSRVPGKLTVMYTYLTWAAPPYACMCVWLCDMCGNDATGC